MVALCFIAPQTSNLNFSKMKSIDKQLSPL